MIIRSLLAKQLGYPSGIFGRLVMKLLNKSNAEMNDLTFTKLNVQPGDFILEIGFGGGYLLDKIVTSRIPSLIVGIDPTIDVIKMGNKKFKQLIAQKYIELKQASAETLPYDDCYFDKICTVNTIYFWSDPKSALDECNRVLKLNGKLVISYNSSAFLEKTKLTQHGFKTYEPENLELLMQSSGFTDISTISADGGTSNEVFYCTSGSVA